MKRFRKTRRPKSISQFSSTTTIEKMRFSGFLAQEVEAIVNEIGYDFSGVDRPGTENGLYGLRYAEFTVPLVKAVQELNDQMKQLQAENIRLQQELNRLKADMKNCCNSWV
ncbi:MAG: hypothetical protein H6603_01535 [Flavobacteriales bacterium]|nr:hypothetical protein [Flavobacteriales bacterium]